jgi:hypothetical protein
MKQIYLSPGIFLVIIEVLFNTLYAQPAGGSEIFFIHGQIRSGYYFIESRNNAGTVTKTPEWRMRARFGMTYRFSDKVSFTARLAGRYSTVQEKFEFWYHPYAASPGGLRLGQTAFDMFHVEYNDGNRWMMQAGRMQHGFQLKGLIAKGIDRYNSPNVSITWTDGLWLRYLVHLDWYIHGVIQYNHRTGSTSFYTPPLNFNDANSRFSFFTAIEGKVTSGLWYQRELSITLMPAVFRNSTTDELSSYWAFTGRIGINVPLNITLMNVRITGEAGYAPTTPDMSQLGLSTDVNKTDDAFAWQVSVNLLNIFNRHNLGFLYGETDPGWLIAPSFRNNTNTFEVRHQFRFSRNLTSEIRYRIRNQLYMPVNASVKRRDDDLYARITYRF